MSEKSPKTIFAPACEIKNQNPVIAFNRLRAGRKNSLPNIAIPILMHDSSSSIQGSSDMDSVLRNLKTAAKSQLGISGKTSTAKVLERAHNPAGSYMSQAALKGANIVKKDLSGADMSGSDLRGVKISGSNLSHVNLTNAYVGGMTIDSSVLSGANLTDLKVTPWHRDSSTPDHLTITNTSLQHLPNGITHQSQMGLDLQNVNIVGYNVSNHKEANRSLINAISDDPSVARKIEIDEESLKKLWQTYFLTPSPIYPINYERLNNAVNSLKKMSSLKPRAQILKSLSEDVLITITPWNRSNHSGDIHRLTSLNEGLSAGIDTICQFDETGYIKNYADKINKDDKIDLIHVFKYIISSLGPTLKMKNCAKILISTIEYKDNSKRNWRSILDELQLVSKTDLAGIRDFVSEIFWKYTIPTLLQTANTKGSFDATIKNLENIGVEDLEKNYIPEVGNLLNRFSVLDIIGFSQRFHDFGFKDIRDSLHEIGQPENSDYLENWHPIIPETFSVNGYRFKPLTSITDITTLSKQLSQCLHSSSTLLEDCKRLKLVIFEVTDQDGTLSTLGYKVKIIDGRIHIELKEHTGDQSRGLLNASKDDPKSVNARQILENHIRRTNTKAFLDDLRKRREGHLLAKIGIVSKDPEQITKLLAIINFKLSSDSYSPYRDLVAQKKLLEMRELLANERKAAENLKTACEDQSVDDERIEELYLIHEEVVSNLVNFAVSIPELINQNPDKSRKRKTQVRLLKNKSLSL